MKYHTLFVICMITVATFTIGTKTGSAQGRAGTVASYTCQPNTCLKIDQGSILKLTMNIFGHFVDVDDPNITRDRGIIGVSTANCSSSVNMAIYGDTVEAVYLGEGIEVKGDTSQFGFPILSRNLILYMYGAGGTGSGSVPCD